MSPARGARQRRRAAQLVVLVAALAVLLPGCAGSATSRELAAVSPHLLGTGSTAGAVSAAAVTDRTALEAAWRRSFRRLERKLSGPAGVAVLPVGASASDLALTAGTWTTGVAWSTAKVPVTVAAQRRSASARTERRARRAITQSDNRAAEQLWSQLGTPRVAARRAQRVLRDAGDTSTVVQRRRVRPGFTAFGQTRWALTDQARFAAGLRCLPDGQPVLALMGRITPSQRWGLGQRPGTRFKGGWGPVGSGYLVRQLGVVTLPDGSEAGVAIAVSSPDGFTRGTRDLTRINRWLTRRLGAVTGGHCPSG